MEAMVRVTGKQRELGSTIAMSMTILSFAMLFATMFLGYAVYRLTSTVWPPMGMENISLTLPIISTLLILLSSGTYYVFERNYNLERLGNLSLFYFGTLILGLAFVGSQFAIWQEMALVGLYKDAGIFPSLLYGFTWTHAAHMAAALLLIIWLFPLRKQLALNGVKKEHLVKNVGIFWHFLTIIWLLIFVTLFVI